MKMRTRAARTSAGLGSRKRREENFWGYFFIIPALFFFAMFVVLPMVQSVTLSLYRNVQGVRQWSGLQNFARIFQDSVFIESLKNTFLFVLYIVPTVICLALFIAVQILDKSMWKQTFFRASFYLPSVISIVSVSLVWRNLYNYHYGIINFVLNAAGLPSVNWLGNSYMVVLSLSLIVVTINVGMPLILYLAAISGIPDCYYEAAHIDGAGGWFTFWHITVPFIMPTTLYIFITTTIASFQVFGVIDLITAGGPSYSSSTVMYYLYKTAFNFYDFHRAAAMGVVLFLCISVLAFVQFRRLSKSFEY
jgi:multiple sugar transport system permease protein